MKKGKLIGRILGIGLVFAIILGLAGLARLSGPVLGDDPVVHFPDLNLETAIREAIGKPTGDIYQSNLLGLTSLNAFMRGIANIAGLEYCINLENLMLEYNDIVNLKPLSNLSNLDELWLRVNKINDTNPLSSLTNLRVLCLDDNEISNLQPLSVLSGLEELFIQHNSISDIGPLSGLINLRYLSLMENQINNIGPLSSLTNLVDLRLGGNEIASLQPLSSLTDLGTLYLWTTKTGDMGPLSGLVNLRYLLLSNNEITDLSPLSGLTSLQELTLDLNQISDISPLSGLVELAELCLDDNQIADITPLRTLTKLGEFGGYEREGVNICLGLSNNQISDINGLVENEGLGEEDGIDLRGNPLSALSLATHIPQLQERGVTVLYDIGVPIARASDISGQPRVMFPDTEYTMTAKYFDPDGRDNLNYCCLRLQHPDKPLNMMWNQAIDDFWVYAGELGENYLTVTGNSTPITEGGLEGYELTWTFTINTQWPEVENAIDFGVFANDDQDKITGWDYDDTNADFVVPPFLPVLISPLLITPEKDMYEIGETLTAQFTIRNQGAMPFTLDVLTVGGRCNGWCLPSGCPDFPHRGVTLQHGETYHYEGDFTLPRSGNYLFFPAYYIDSPTPDEAKLLDENNWNTNIDLGMGLAPQDRIRTLIVPQTQEEADLSVEISRLLAIKVQYPPYLLTPEGFQMSVAIVWMNWTSWLAQVELNEKYDELYFTGIDYDCASRKALLNAKAALDRGDVEIAQEYVQDYFLYNKLSLMSFNAATNYFSNIAGAGEILAEGVRDGCQTAIKFGLTFLSPEAAKAADYVFIGSDFVIDYFFRGEDEALKDSLVKLAINALFKEIRLAPGGRTIENYIANRVGKVTFPLLQTWIKSGEWQFFLSKSLKYGAEWLSEETAEEVALSILDELGKSVDSMRSELKSPAALLVYDSHGNATGLSNGQVEHGIPRSMYANEVVTLFFPSDPCTYYVIGKGDGVYGLEVSYDEGGNTTSFNSIDIPTTPGALHQYSIDWEALSEGGVGVTIKIDSDGDGVFEETVVTSQPNMPANPSPANHAASVGINANLSWVGGDPDAGDTVTYDVYFGTSETPPLKATIGPYPAAQSSITYDPGTLVDGTTYHWKIVARDNHGITKEGPLWEFATGDLSEDEPSPEVGFASIADELVMVYYYAGSGVWDVYWPKFGIDTIGAVEAGKIYIIYVDSDCTLEYGTHSYELDGPDWNFIYWLPQ